MANYFKDKHKNSYRCSEYSKVGYSITLAITDSSKVKPKYCDCFITQLVDK